MTEEPPLEETAAPDVPLEEAPSLAHHGSEENPVEGTEMPARRRRAPVRHELQVDPTQYSWDELVEFVREGYNVDTSWRFSHLDEEQKGALRRKAAKAA